MHAGLAALAEEGDPVAAGLFQSLVSRVKTFAGSTENVRTQAGKLAILARTFFAPTQFSKPANRTEALARMTANARHYKSIYTVFFFLVLLYTLLSSPLLLIGLSTVAGAWLYSFVLTNQDEPLQLFGFELRRREKLLALVPFSLIVVLLCGLVNSLISVCFFTAVLCVPHASFHEVTEFDALDRLELEGLQSGVPSIPSF